MVLPNSKMLTAKIAITLWNWGSQIHKRRGPQTRVKLTHITWWTVGLLWVSRRVNLNRKPPIFHEIWGFLAIFPWNQGIDWWGIEPVSWIRWGLPISKSMLKWRDWEDFLSYLRWSWASYLSYLRWYFMIFLFCYCKIESPWKNHPFFGREADVQGMNCRALPPRAWSQYLGWKCRKLAVSMWLSFCGNYGRFIRKIECYANIDRSICCVDSCEKSRQRLSWFQVWFLSL